MSLTIADRRAVMTLSMLQSDFRDLLRRDPRAALERATGRTPPEDTHVAVIEEQADAWEFVVPAGEIEGELPMPGDARSVVENDVYELLRDAPDLRGLALRDPKGFLASRLDFDIGASGINMHEEQPGEWVLIMPFGNSREELGDAALDMVAGGGDPGVQNGNPNSQRTTARPWEIK